MRIIFGILSSCNTADIVQQIIDAIGPDHTVIIHHDFSKQPEFHVTGSDVHIIENYVKTSWGDWSLVEATIRLMETALTKGKFDYFQLLSDTCIPIQPIDKFVDYLNSEKPDVNIDSASLLDEPMLMMSHGYRVFAQKQTIQHRLLRKLKYWYECGKTELRMIAGLSSLTTESIIKRYFKIPIFLLQYILLQLATRGVGFSHPFGQELKCHLGSQWFGCSPTICQGVLEWMKNNESVVAYFKNIQIPDEFFFQTVILKLSPKNIMESNHFINSFDKATNYSGPAFLEIGDLDQVTSSGKFFARKFPKESEHPVRLMILNNLNSSIARTVLPRGYPETTKSGRVLGKRFYHLPILNGHNRWVAKKPFTYPTDVLLTNK